MIIGQKELTKKLYEQIHNDELARFIILVGPRGSGKHLVSMFIADELDAIPYWVDTKVDAIRDAITSSYKITQPAVYMIEHADNLSMSAKNALLKVTEEPPNNAYFIMTVEDIVGVLGTIRSRASIFYMNQYTPDEIEEYIDYKLSDVFNLSKFSIQILKDICDTPGDVDLLVTNTNVEEFYNYVELVTDAIAEVSGANSFKIASKVALKDGESGYDLQLFWKAFVKICVNRALSSKKTSEDFVKYGNAIPITGKYLQKLRVRGANKQMLMDQWILSIREAWM